MSFVHTRPYGPPELNLSTDRPSRDWAAMAVGNPYAQRVETRVDRMTVTLKDFYADWCGPCKTQDPILEELEEDWEGQFEVEKVNVDEQQDVANEYQVRSLPTLVIENDDGIVERFVGVTQRDDLEDALESAGA
nr:thioredoxin domain-containing protein [Natrinema limicola]